MDSKDCAVILDLRTLAGTANIFSKHDMYRAMWGGKSVTNCHTTIKANEPIILPGQYSLLSLSTNKRLVVSFTNEKAERITLDVRKMLVLDGSFLKDIELKYDWASGEANVTYTALTSWEDGIDSGSVVSTTTVGFSTLG